MAKHNLHKYQKKAKRVEVTWLDSDGYALGGWQLDDSVEEYANTSPETIISVGYLIHKDKEKIVLCGHLGRECMAGIWKIPMCSVVKVRKL